MMQGIINAVLNTIFVSIPEVIVWVVFVLILLKRKDMLDVYFWKENLKQIMIPVIPVAVSINLMRYILHIDNLINFIIIEIMISCLVIYIIKKNNFLNEKINYFKIIIYIILADFILNIMAEGICVLTITYVLHMTIEQINNHIFLNIILSILPRVLQVLLLSFCIYRQTVGEMINYIELILKNRILTISMLVFLSMIIILNFIFGRFFIGMQLLNHYTLIVEVMFIILMLLIPIIMISSYIISVYNLLLENSKLQRQKDNIYDNTI